MHSRVTPHIHGMGTAACCYDCGVAPGLAHRSGCDIELCPGCGAQRLFCPCDGSLPHTVWTGEFPGVEEARALGWWARYTADGWQPCPPDAPGAIPDLNRLGFCREDGFDGNYSAEELAAGLAAEQAIVDESALTEEPPPVTPDAELDSGDIEL